MKNETSNNHETANSIKPDVSGELLLKDLETKLNTSDSYSIPYHEDSIMTYGKIYATTMMGICVNTVESGYLNFSKVISANVQNNSVFRIRS